MADFIEIDIKSPQVGLIIDSLYLLRNTTFGNLTSKEHVPIKANATRIINLLEGSHTQYTIKSFEIMINALINLKSAVYNNPNFFEDCEIECDVEEYKLKVKGALYWAQSYLCFLGYDSALE